MELRHLRYFAAVAEALNFSRAAEKLRVAQPALSRQVRDLEEEMGVQLLERNRVHVRLTDAGRIFLGHVRRLLAQVDVAVTAAQEAARGHDGTLVICSDWRLSMSPVPETIVAFRARYPRVEVELAELRLHEQTAALRAGRIHLGFVPREMLGERDDLSILPVVRSEIMAVLPGNHRTSGCPSVRLRDLKGEQWLWVDDEHAPGFRGYISQSCRLAGFAPEFGRSAATLEGLLALVAAGYGAALLPRFVAPAAQALVCTVPTDCEPLELCAVWRREEPSQLLRNYLEIMRAALAAREAAPAS